MIHSKNKNSLEDAVRLVQNRYKNRPSPLTMMNENSGPMQPQVHQEPRAHNDIRGNLLGNFRPPNDTFR